MDYTVKLAYQSNYWYNDGLAKAQVRDMSGAITSLKKSLQYNRANLAARNLLGLVYYGRGDVIEALVERILSKNFQPKENIASYFISKVQETPGELEEVNQAVKRYNQSLEYARQGGEDLAIIQLKKAVADTRLTSKHTSFWHCLILRPSSMPVRDRYSGKYTDWMQQMKRQSVTCMNLPK